MKMRDPLQDADTSWIPLLLICIAVALLGAGMIERGVNSLLQNHEDRVRQIVREEMKAVKEIELK